MGLFFYFKRFVGVLLQPLPLVWLFLLTGMALLALTKKRRLGWACLCLAVVTLFVASFSPVSRVTVRALESGQTPVLAPTAETIEPFAIAVLGSGVDFPFDAAMPALSRLNDTARTRLVEGVRLARLFPAARLITSGYGLGSENCGDVMAEAAVELGIAPERVDRLVTTVDTAHEAEEIGKMAAGRKVVVVTSAVHMRRAMHYFTARNIDAVPAPCGFASPASLESVQSVDWYRWRPKGQIISDSEASWHELMGLSYYYLFGGDKARGE